MPEIQVDWHSRDEFERLRELRDRHGMLWRGVLLEGAKQVESTDLLQALLELNPALAKDGVPGDHEGISTERMVVRDQIREQILERERARAQTNPTIDGSETQSEGDVEDGSTKDGDPAAEYEIAEEGEVHLTSPHLREFDAVHESGDPDEWDTVDSPCDYDYGAEHGLGD